MRFSIPKVETKILVIAMKILILILFPILLQAQTYEYRWSREITKVDSTTVKFQPKDRTSGQIIINDRILKVVIKPEGQEETVLDIDHYNTMNYPTTFTLDGYTCYLRRNMLIINYRNKIVHYKLRPSS